jgi:uncharacterized NAD(P)/FAD-binding protein YdhS
MLQENAQRKRPSPARIAIIGGGFTGAAVALNIVSATRQFVEILIFEPRQKLGAGLAYDTDNPVHRINVPAIKMSVSSEDPLEFQNWLDARGIVQDDPAGVGPDGHYYARRQSFGDYVDDKIRPYITDGRVCHIRQRVTAVDQDKAGFQIETESGDRLHVDVTVIATSHPSPTAPEPLASFLFGNPAFIQDGSAPSALDGIEPGDSVLVVGNGLTASDIIASLLAKHHNGAITAISRRGLRSRGHSPLPFEPFGDFVTIPIQSAQHLLMRIRQTIQEAADINIGWQAVIDGVRAQGPQIWSSLPLLEKRRVIRHLRPYWDVHRFRIAPQVLQAIERAIESGQVNSFAASITSVSYFRGKICIGFRRGRTGELLCCEFDKVVIATGPSHRDIIDKQPYIAKLAREGMAALDATKLGLDVDQSSRLRGRGGVITDRLYVAGPLARGRWGELMGLPQVTQHARFVAGEILFVLGKEMPPPAWQVRDSNACRTNHAIFNPARRDAKR